MLVTPMCSFPGQAFKLVEPSAEISSIEKQGGWGLPESPNGLSTKEILSTFICNSYKHKPSGLIEQNNKSKLPSLCLLCL